MVLRDRPALKDQLAYRVPRVTLALRDHRVIPGRKARMVLKDHRVQLALRDHKVMSARKDLRV